METRELTVYKFWELDEAAKEKALDAYRYMQVEYWDWWESVDDYITTAADLLGIERAKIEGFDLDRGAYIALRGSYSYRKGAPALIRAEFGENEELISIAKDLQEAQRPMFYQGCANLVPYRRGIYGEGTAIEVAGYGDLYNDDYIEDNKHTLIEPLQDFLHWALSRLLSEYEFLTSDELIEEMLIDNEYDFLENGDQVYHV